MSGLDGPDKGGLSSETLLADLLWSVNGERHDRRVVVRLPPPRRRVAGLPLLRPRPAGSRHGGRAPRLVRTSPRSALVRTRPGTTRRSVHRDGTRSTASPHPTTCPTRGAAGSPSMTADEQAQSRTHASTCSPRIHGVELTAEIDRPRSSSTTSTGSPLRRHFESERRAYDWARDGRALSDDRARIRGAGSPLARARG